VRAAYLVGLASCSVIAYLAGLGAGRAGRWGDIGGGRWRLRGGKERLENECTYLLLVVQTLVVVLKVRHAFRLARVVFGVGVCDVAGEDFLPEGEAARGACVGRVLSVCVAARVRVLEGQSEEGCGRVGR
jgi:hypothetical protein